MTTTAATAVESSQTDPFELGVKDGIVHYARRVVATPVGRWLVVVSMLLGLYPDGSVATQIHPTVHVAIAFVNAVLILFIADFARAEYRREGGEDE